MTNIRKNYQCKASVSWKDIHNCYDLLYTYHLCNEHKQVIDFKNTSDEDIVIIQIKCHECKKVLNIYHNSMKKICKQLSKDLEKQTEY